MQMVTLIYLLLWYVAGISFIAFGTMHLQNELHPQLFLAGNAKWSRKEKNSFMTIEIAITNEKTWSITSSWTNGFFRKHTHQQHFEHFEG